MSTTIGFHEQLTIKSNYQCTRDMQRALIAYIQQFNAMIGMEDMYIAYMELSNGDQKAIIKDFQSVEPENTLVLTEQGIAPQQAQHCVWAEDHPLIRLLHKLDENQETVFRFSGSVTYLYTTEYGIRYWENAISHVRPGECIDYRGIQSADTDDDVQAVMYSKDGTISEVCRDKDIDAVRDISLWYAENFHLQIITEEKEKFDAFREETEDALNDLIDYLENEYLEADAFEGEAETLGSLTLRNDQITGLLIRLQKIIDETAKFNAKASLMVELVPDENTQNGIPNFAVLRISVQDGTVKAQCCRFDAC